MNPKDELLKDYYTEEEVQDIFNLSKNTIKQKRRSPHKWFVYILIGRKSYYLKKSVKARFYKQRRKGLALVK